MRELITISVLACLLFSCKNNGQNTGQAKSTEVEETVKPVVSNVKEIVIENRKPVKPDFSILGMTNENDILTVVVRYSGGCEEHDFNAYFSGGWAKSMPPQAAILFEHLNPNNDACRGMVKDTFQFDMKPLQYAGAKEVVVKWANDPKISTTYQYGK